MQQCTRIVGIMFYVDQSLVQKYACGPPYGNPGKLSCKVVESIQ